MTRSLNRPASRPESRSHFRPPRLHGRLGSPRDYYDVMARLVVLTRAHADAFDNATLTDTVRSIFEGYDLCGYRAGGVDEDRHVYLLRKGSHWFGFGLHATTEKPPPPKTLAPGEMLDEMWLFLHLSREHRDRAPWYSLRGAERLGQIRATLTATTLDGPIGTGSAVDFLERAQETVRMYARGDYTSHAQHLADIMLRDTLADDAAGTLAAARTLAGLGRYPHLVTPSPRSA